MSRLYFSLVCTILASVGCVSLNPTGPFAAYLPPIEDGKPVAVRAKSAPTVVRVNPDDISEENVEEKLAAMRDEIDRAARQATKSSE